MNEVNIMEQVRKFLLTCPLLAEGKLNVDFLPEDVCNYSIEAVPAKEIVRSYVNGASVRQFLFVVASREFYGEEIKQQLDNLSFYDNFSGWLMRQTRGKNLPELGEHRKALLMEASTSGYVMAAEANMERYQIQCRLEYFQTM